jgi:iron(III) transport system substrate-binding protein
MRNRLAAAAALIVSALSIGAQSVSERLVVYCPHPLEFINPIVKEFEVETGIRVEVVQAGTGEILKRIEEEKANPQGDVMWGGSRASIEAYRSRFDPYMSTNLPAILGRYIPPDYSYTPFTIIPTVFMYNKHLVSPSEIPRSWADLLSPEWKGRIAFADPALSSSSFEALVNMLFAMGRGDPERGWDYVGSFIATLGGKLLGGSSAVYKGVADGEYAVGVTFEEAAAKYLRQGAPVGIVYPEEGTIVEADGVAVIKGARNLSNARRFVDFVTSQKAQAKIARSLDRRSCRSDTPPAVGLATLGDMHVIPGDFKWAGESKARILERFEGLLRGP